MSILELKCAIIPFFKDDIILYSLTSQDNDNIKIDSSQNIKILVQLMKNPKKQNLLFLTKMLQETGLSFYYSYFQISSYQKFLKKEIVEIINNQIFKGNSLIVWSDISKICPFIRNTGIISVDDFKRLCLNDSTYLNYLIAISSDFELSLRIFSPKKRARNSRRYS